MPIDVRLIAAVGRSGQLGIARGLPWRDPLDLKWFKAQTMGGVVLMGGRTYDAVGVLPGRFRARWSGDTSPFAVLSQLDRKYKNLPIWIAGGSFTYAAFMPFVRYVVVTRIDYDGEADAFMPPLWDDYRSIVPRTAELSGANPLSASPLQDTPGDVTPKATTSAFVRHRRSHRKKREV